VDFGGRAGGKAVVWGRTGRLQGDARAPAELPGPCTSPAGPCKTCLRWAPGAPRFTSSGWGGRRGSRGECVRADGAAFLMFLAPGEAFGVTLGPRQGFNSRCIFAPPGEGGTVQSYYCDSRSGAAFRVCCKVLGFSHYCWLA
jgi:hypothetical protein